MSKIGILGSGQVAQILALGFKKHGHDVMIGSREPAKLTAWQAEKGAGIAVGDFAATARHAEVVVLAVLGRAAASALELAGHDNLAGKVVIDTTNPIDEKPPVNGVLQYFTGPNDSLMEQLQQKVPAARLVKAFNSVGNSFMVNPSFADGRPTMFICGNDAAAKQEVTRLCEQLGWDTEDMGQVESARAIEPLCQLWCVRGFNRNQWTHAFKLIKG
ncbi:MAG TPA: NAD(P)-binding domain-containing protein [Pseudomonadota bacterium]|nr:NAD(P)-binding domain-containing protein [Pseudomonadota bacterium]